MAIPNNYIDKITNKDTGESRIISPAADMVRVANENYEGADLDEVLDEISDAFSELEQHGLVNGRVPFDEATPVVLASLDGDNTDITPYSEGDYFAVLSSEKIYQVENGAADEVGEIDDKLIYCDKATGNLYRWDYTTNQFVQVGGNSGGGDGTVTGVKMNNGQPIPPDENGVVDLGTVITDVSNKVDKVTGYGLSKNDYSDADKTKLTNIEPGAEVNVISGIKANGASETLPVDQNGIVTLPPAASPISPATAAPSMDGTAGVGVSDKYAREDHVHPHDTSKQDTLTFDNAPTAGSNNPVKSGGIKTAIDQVTPTINENGKWVIGGVATDKDAQGPRGNTVLVNENAVGIQALIVNNLFDGGEDDILSAEMGKVLRQNIMKIFNALGTYAFPEGKPTLNWGSTVINHSINVNGVTGGLTIADVEVDGVSEASLPAQIVEGKSLSLRLVLSSDLYVFNDGVSITMGGVNITTQQGVWDESTGEINIAAVTDNIVIAANAITYVQRGLVMHLDGRNRGGTTGKWKSLVDYNSNPLYFKLENCDEQSDYVAGNGTNSKGTAFSNSALTTDVTLLDVGAAEGTIEAAYSHAEIASNGNLPIMHNGLGSGNRICLTSWHNTNVVTQDSENVLTMCTAQGSAETIPGGVSYPYPKTSINTGGYISLKQGSFMLNGTTVAANGTTLQSTTGESKLSIFYRRTSNDQFAKYRLYALRVYSVQLTDDERAQNLAVDQKRFNI